MIENLMLMFFLFEEKRILRETIALRFSKICRSRESDKFLTFSMKIHTCDPYKL